MHFPTKALNEHASKNDAEAIKLLKKIFNLKD
jgi:glutamyl-tRNA reductase